MAIGVVTLTIFTITKIFPMLQLLLGQHGTYWLMGSIALSSNAFFYFFVPETKGKSPEEMKAYFMPLKNEKKMPNSQDV